jgi:glycosyltransferase involved in cell wall biosynthesis
MIPASGQLNRSEMSASHSGQAGRLDAHVVILINYVRKHHVVALQALANRVRKLTVLVSVPMEPDRSWDALWEDLDVRVQRNWMLTANWKHSTGFQEANFIHIPIDTNSQLKSLKPDIVFSYEMGFRTLLSSWYRRFHRNVPLVMVGNMSEHIERERGLMRRSLRWLIRRGIDYYTYNGPSCKRYLESLSIDEDRLFHVPYCIDSDVVFRGDRMKVVESNETPRRLLYCGAMSQRKGILQFAQSLNRWSQQHPQRRVELSIAGSGPLQQAIADYITPNLSIKFLGNCDPETLRDEYGGTNICVFPTLADEWGLVPIEALASGVPVLGSVFAQSVETVVEEGRNGWVFEPTDSDSMEAAIDRAMNCSPGRLLEMEQYGKASVAHITGAATAEKFCHVIKTVLPDLKLNKPR